MSYTNAAFSVPVSFFLWKKIFCSIYLKKNGAKLFYQYFDSFLKKKNIYIFTKNIVIIEELKTTQKWNDHNKLFFDYCNKFYKFLSEIKLIKKKRSRNFI